MACSPNAYAFVLLATVLTQADQAGRIYELAGETAYRLAERFRRALARRSVAPRQAVERPVKAPATAPRH